MADFLRKAPAPLLCKSVRFIPILSLYFQYCAQRAFIFHFPVVRIGHIELEGMMWTSGGFPHFTTRAGIMGLLQGL